MSSSYGENIRLTIFGQSHSLAIGMTIEGIPAGEKIDFDSLYAFLERRAPGKNKYSTTRREADKPEFLCGIVGDTFCGTPVTAIIRNTDTHSADYEAFKKVPRPGHADYTAEIKYNGAQDYAGGGHFSGRLTAPLCIAGAICKQLLAKNDIQVITRILSIGDVSDSGELLCSTEDKPFPVVDDQRGKEMQDLIARVKAQGDSVGGIIECAVLGLPAGLGNPIFDGMENRISSIIFGIPAVKGIEFGAGFDAAKMQGSQNNDVFCVVDGAIKTKTNNCGGILGGITTGMPLVFRTAVKPTPSIYKPQESVDITTGKESQLVIHGRHDPCIVPRAVPCVEAAAAIAVYDALMERKKELYNNECSRLQKTD